MSPTTTTTLDVEAFDVTATPWDDLIREVLADEPDAMAPIFFPDRRDLQNSNQGPGGGCSGGGSSNLGALSTLSCGHCGGDGTDCAGCDIGPC